MSQKSRLENLGWRLIEGNWIPPLEDEKEPTEDQGVIEELHA